VTPWLAALAVAVVAGGIVAVSAREARVAILGLTICGVTAPLLADPPPAPLPLAGRLLAAILAGYLLWISTRERPLTRGSRVGWPAEALLAAAAAVAGLGAAGFAGPAGGPPEAEAAAFALGALAVGPILRASDIFRLAIGLLLAVLGAGVGRVALAGTAVPLDQLVIAGLTIVLAAAVGTIARNEARLGAGIQPAALRPPPARVMAPPRAPFGGDPRVTAATSSPRGVDPPRGVDAPPHVDPPRALDAARPTGRGLTAALERVRGERR
jgi:hypothetical protein